MRRLTALLLLLVVCVPLFAAESIEGHWNGAIVLPSMKLEVQLDIERAGEGWRGDISIPMQNARDIPLGAFAVDGAKVSFQIRGVPGTPTFTGTLSGDRIEGSFTQSGQTFPFTLERAGAAGKVAVSAAAASADPLAGFDAFVNGALKSWDVPGLAVAVVADGRVVYAKGFGMRNAGKALPMTADTLLPIGSITKSFTTVLMGMLVDEGKLEWDKPVRTYLPEFRASDDLLTARLTPRDLVTHRSGLPRHDLVWYNNQDLTRKQIVERLASLSPSEDLRARYQYNNLMFLTAGHLVEELTGQKWEDVARARVLGPLGMTRATFSDADAEKDADHARPYRKDDDTMREIPFREVGNMGPAGSISASVNEMARYALLHLDRGRAGGKELVQATTIREMHTPQVAIGAIPEYPDIAPASYGLGWVVDGYRGHYRVAHGGAIDGFSALLTLFPNDGVAIVALANRDGTALPSVVTLHAADRMLKLDPRDWNADLLMKRDLAEKAEKEAEAKKTATRKSGTKPSHPIADYAGDYEHAGYGVLTIERLAGDKLQAPLQATYNHIVTPLEHWHFDVFHGGKNVNDPTFEDMKYNFRTDVAGNIYAVEASFEPRVDPILFRKRPDARLSDPKHLAQFLGEYVLGPQTIVISLRGSRLVMAIANQRPYELIPDIDGWFNLKGLTGFRARFTGKTIEISQPNGLFTATRK